MFLKASSSSRPSDQHPGSPEHDTATPSSLLFSKTLYFIHMLLIRAVSCVDHKLEQIAVWVTDVRTRTCFPATARAVHGTDLDLHSRVLQPGLQCGRCAIPHEAEVARRRLRGGRPERECRILPACGPVKVDHLRTDVD